MRGAAHPEQAVEELLQEGAEAEHRELEGLLLQQASDDHDSLFEEAKDANVQ